MALTMESMYSDVIRCLNCGLAIQRCRKKDASSLPPKALEILTKWIQDLNGILCSECYNLIVNLSDSTETETPQRVFGHSVICIACGMSLQRIGKIKYRQRKGKIKNEYLQYWPWHEMYHNKVACYKCIQRVKRFEKHIGVKGVSTTDRPQVAQILSYPEDPNFSAGIIHDSNVTPRITSDNQIILSDGKRPPANGTCCYVNKCGNAKQRKIVPKSLQWLMATNYNIYLPENVRVCETHHPVKGYETKDFESRKILSNFTVSKFESFVDVLKNGVVTIDFENVEAMPSRICKYWTGLKVYEFLDMYESLNKPKIMKSALAVHLIRKITGDSVLRLAKLFNINSATLSKQVRIVEKHFS